MKNKMKNTLLNLIFLLVINSCTTNTDTANTDTANTDTTNNECLCDPSIEIINISNIEGYTDCISYYPGDTIKIYASSKSKNFDVDFIEQSLQKKSLLKFTSSKGSVQNYNQCSFKDGCNWAITEKIIIPTNSNSGYKTIRLSNDYGQFQIPIIVKSRLKSNILCIASTNTWHAYNGWGGASFYRYNFIDSCVNKPFYSSQLSTCRPLEIVSDLTYQGHLFDAELGLIHWLEKKEYNFDVITDKDLHDNPDIVNGYKIVFLNTHSEYWSENGLHGLEEYIQNQGSLCYLGANGLYWKVTINENTIECQKENGLHICDSTKGGLWRNLGRPEEKLIGVSYNRTGYNTYMPYVVINEEHWLYEKTNLKNGDLFGKSLNRKFASGHETDKTTINSPKNVVIIARGLNQEAVDELGKPGADKNGGADMIFYKHPAGGYIFSSGSITSGASMLIDTNMSTIMTNLLEKIEVKTHANKK